MWKHVRQQQGMALIFVMISIIVILGAFGVIMTQVNLAKKGTDQHYGSILAEEAAQAGIDLAIKSLWDDYVATSGNTTRNWASFRYFLNNTLEIPINEDLNFNGSQDAEETGNGNTVFEVYPAGYDHRGWALLDGAVELNDPNDDRLLATIDSVHIARYDEVSQSILTVTATASSDGHEKTAVQVLTIGGQFFSGAQFAILANNISCILCHAEFKSLQLEQNTDADNHGTFDRIKIASLESLLVRPNASDSHLAGTLYTRGKVYKQNGSLFSANDLNNDSQFRGYEFSGEDGKITQDGSGNMSQTPFVNADTNEDGDLDQFSNLYMDYPTEDDLQTDGPVPDSFPAPFPDDNGNRHVDDEEFEVIVNSANGRLDFAFGEPDESGSIAAGVAYGVPAGDVYDGDGLPEASNEALAQLRADGSYSGNLILVGTEDDPIIIDKSVAIDGDLMIAGPVKGYGQLLVRGNTYIAGDVTYADDPGEFGKYTDGAGVEHENAFALVSGGSIMMGDYLSVRGVNHSAKNNSKYPTWSQYSIHARDEHRANTITKNDVTETLEWGYFDEWSVDAGEAVTQLKNDPNGRPGDQFSFTTSELKLFNNLELEKALDDPDYIPRFYGLRESQPNNVYVYDDDDEHSVRYSESGVKLLSDYIIDEGLPIEILAKAAYHYCSPQQNWISEDSLRTIWHDDEMTRPSSGRDFLFDGLLYSNNSIWAIVRSYTRHKSYTKGRMTVRGGIIAADLGVFVPGHSGRGLDLLYDPRVERFLDVRDTNVVTLARTAFYYKAPESEES